MQGPNASNCVTFQSMRYRPPQVGKIPARTPYAVHDMPPAKLTRPDMAQLLEDIRWVNQAARNEAQRLEAQLRRRIADTWMPGPAGDALLEEIAAALGALSAQVRLAEQGVNRLQQELTSAGSSERGHALPPGAVVFTCDRLGEGAGLLAVETSANGVSFRWSGADPRVEMTLPLDRARAWELHILLFALIRPEFARQMRIHVDGQPVPHRFARDGAVFVVSARVPAAAGKSAAQVVLQLPATHSPAELGLSADRRALGVAVSEVRFVPVPGAWTRLLRSLRPSR